MGQPENSVATGSTQINWRWCNKCQALSFAGGRALGACPAGGLHAHTGSGNYGVPSYWVDANLLPSPGLQLSSQSNPVNHSESDIVLNPANLRQMLAVSKRFPDPGVYSYQADAYRSLDGGSTWQEIRFPAYYPPGATQPANLSDPVVAWGPGTSSQPYGVCYTAFNIVPAGMTAGVSILVYMSTDAGLHWTVDTVISAPSDGSPHDYDKQSIAMAYDGPVLSWVDNGNLRFARRVSTTWYGTHYDPPGSLLQGGSGGGGGVITDGWSPEIAVSGTGVIFIAWQGGTTIKVISSYDFGYQFSNTYTAAATGISPIYDGFLLPDARFRTTPVPTISRIGDKGVAVAWADIREGHSRIYYAFTRDGTSWVNGPTGSGIPLTPAGAAPAGENHLMPRLAATTSGAVVGCAFYIYLRPSVTGTTGLLAPALHAGLTHGSEHTNTSVIDFTEGVMVSDRWVNPEVGTQTVSAGSEFYGDYFGLAATDSAFFPAWTDTRTGHQEIYLSAVYCGLQ